MKKKFFAGIVLALSSLISFSAAAAIVQSEDFATSIATGSTAAADTWYTDRYAPAGFTATGGQLVQTISSADSVTNRPAAYSSAFYNTQGRKFDLDAGVTSLSIDLYVDSDWGLLNQRVAGLWATAFDASNGLSGYPILEFASDGTTGRLQGWDNGTWIDYGLSSSFAYDTMHTLGIELVGGLFNYTLDGNLLGSVDANGSTRLGNVILQGYNTYGSDQGTRTIIWDNLEASNDIPEPGTLPLALSAMVGGLMIHRRRKTT